MLAFLVEDGTGIEDATSSVSVADYKAYVLGKTGVAATQTDAAIEAGLIRASAWMAARYERWMSGYRKYGREQGQPFPRVGAIDASGEEIAEDVVPREWKFGVAEAAIREVATAGSLSPDIVPTTTSGGAVKRKKLGSMEIEYTEGSTSGVVVPRFPEIEAVIAPLLTGVVSRGAMVPLLRA